MNKNQIQVIKGDITKLEVDVIVNAANKSLLGGGGVDGAIHRAAGKALLDECKTLNGCETGRAKITRGYDLPAAFVIHTAGPVWRGGNSNEKSLLGSCYTESLRLAAEHQLGTVAFPNISTGIYGFPKHEAAAIAIERVKEFLAESGPVTKVIFCCFDDENYTIYQGLLKS